jgi:hypothetical protein
MSRDAAKIAMELVTRNAAEQDAVLTKIQSLCTEGEFNEFKLMIGKPIGAMLFEIINPIIAKYPDLKPSELR